MLDRFTGMQVLSRVAALGSFSAAARALGMSQTMVTRHVDAIEDRIGARLFHRSTRRLTLTEDTVRAQIRDPERPENMDDRVFREGEWTSTPVSVSVHEIEEFDEVTFVPGAIAWDRIPELIEATYAGVDLEEESITSVSYDRIAGDPPRVYIGVTGLRGSGRLLGRADGTEYDVERT